MISFKTNEGRFNFRVAGILIYKGKVLVHRSVQDDFYAFPGGRVEMFEDTETTLIREMKEELNIDIKIERLLWIAEHFFNLNSEKFHELCFYYLMECKSDESILEEDNFSIVEGNNTFEFRWVEITELENLVVYPTFIKDRIEELPKSVERIVDIE